MMVDIKLDIDRYDGRDYARSDARYCAIYSGRYYLRELPCPQVRSCTYAGRLRALHLIAKLR